jgi:hypothetical protein
LKRGGSTLGNDATRWLGAAILRLDTSTGRTEMWRELKTPDPMASLFPSVVLSADGQAYAFSYQRDLATLYLVKGVR